LSALVQINADIWEPFRASYAALDLTAYLALHDRSLVRVEVGARWIGGLDEYAARVRRGFDKAAERGDRFSIDFRFLDRIASADLATERGVYRLTITAPDGGEQVFYSRFHTVSRRTTEGWRLLVDHDDDEGGTVDAQAFESGRVLDDVAPFES
jgi:ketosteroid isomerase-like protein